MNELFSEFDIPNYYKSALMDFSAVSEFAGATVLEVGGSSLPPTLVLDKLRVRQWLCVDILTHTSGKYQLESQAEHYRDVQIIDLTELESFPNQDYLIINGSVNDIPNSFFNRFDLVVSVNSFEHISDLSGALAIIFFCLKKDGVLLSQFGPIWSCNVGSHFWVSENFNFNTPAPLPPWAHLLMSPSEIYFKLKGSGLSDNIIEQVEHQIFRSDFINRLFFDDYRTILNNSPFLEFDIEPLWCRHVPDEIQIELEQRYPEKYDFSAYGIRVVAHKKVDQSDQLDSNSIMPSILVCGAGCSGTSTLAGLFDCNGRYMGDNIYPASHCNPKGFYDNAEINNLNERLIIESVSAEGSFTLFNRLLDGYHPGQLWLAQFPQHMQIVPCNGTREDIRKLIEKSPFCFNDPRFCFTSEAWLEEAPNVLVLCVFRNPSVTVESILTICREKPYLFNLRISVDDAYAIWRQAYLRMLRLYTNHDNIFFVRYEDLFDDSRLDTLEKLVGSTLNRASPDPAYFPSKPASNPDPASSAIYEALITICADDFGSDRPSKLHLVDALASHLLELPKRHQPDWSITYSESDYSPYKIAPYNYNSTYHIGIDIPPKKDLILECFVDHHGALEYHNDTGILRLQFQLVVIYKDTETLGLCLYGDGSLLSDLNAERIASPYVGNKYKELSWSSSSRFNLNVSLMIEKWPDSMTLMACVSGGHRSIGRLFFTS